MKYALIFLLLVSACSTPEPPQTKPLNKFHDVNLRAIYQQRDQREVDKLLPYLKDSVYQLRAEAALAMGSIQDSTAIPALTELLSDSMSVVRKNAAFALGQQYDSTLQTNLRKALQQEQDAAVIRELLEAIGKCSDQTTLTFITQYQGSEEGQAWGLYRCGLRGLHNPEAVGTALRLLESERSQAQLGAAHFLGRTRNLNLADHYSSLSDALQANSQAEVRMALATALGKTGIAAQASLLQLLTDGDYRVQINALRALSNLPAIDNWDPILKSLTHQNQQVALTATQLMAAHASSELIAVALQKPLPTRVKASLYGTALRKDPKSKALKDSVFMQIQDSDNPYHQAHWINALSNSTDALDLLRSLLDEELQPVTHTALVAGLININSLPEFTSNRQVDLLTLYKKFIGSGDVAASGLAAQALRNPDLGYKPLVEDVGFLEEALGNLTLPQEIETYQELHQTLNYLADRNDTMPATNKTSSYAINWDYISQLQAIQPITIETTKGKIELNLFTEQSPGTVSYILQLVDSGYYEQKTLHRVVPNFVVQGGCPRGDGWGSTPETIRSEFGLRRYTTGSVGMASAGKDTESCQWFITHSPTPHLDGRYTIFAEVTSGMQVVDQLEPGDRIQSIVKHQTNDL